MAREVFVMADGDSCTVWDIQFVDQQRREGREPCKISYLGGPLRDGWTRFVEDSAKVTFTSSNRDLGIGLSGQLSSGDDPFFEVVISDIEQQGDHLRVHGTATRRDYPDPPH